MNRFFRGFWWVAALVFALLAAGPASAQDISCGCSQQRFERPGNCQQSCRKRINCSACMLVPKCQALDVQTFRQFYNRALFGIGNVGLLGMAGPPANDVLVAFIINHWFKPNNITQFHQTWGKPEDTSDWAHVVPASSPGGKLTLTVSPDAIWLSPAGLVMALGHEMVHVEQLKRSYSVRMTGINSALTSFRELEASTWETGARDFSWSIGPSQWSACLPADEKQASEQTRACRDWQVRKSIQDIRSGMRSSQYLPALEKYVNEDPWIKQVWLPQHSNWKTITAGAAPRDCENP